jgi:4-amino-4-deoxy-L-arabinose transferase-like glycosyltransferase
MRSSARTALVVAVLLALALRVALAVGAPTTRIGGDPAVYDEIGASIAAGHGWPRLDRHLKVDPRGLPTALHPPAWPYLLGAAYALTGHGSALDQGPAWLSKHDTAHRRAALAVAHDRWRVARLVNAGLGALAVGLIGLIALELWTPAVAVAAAVLAALASSLAVVGVALLSEPLFVTLELAALLAVLRHRRPGAHPWRWALAAGAAIGLATLTRANGGVLLLPLGLAVWTARPRRTWRALAVPAVLVAAAAVTIAPWTVRNAVVLHAAVPVATDLGQTVAGTYDSAAALDRFRWHAQRHLPPEDWAARAIAPEPARSAALTRQGLRYIAAHPLAVPEASAFNTARLLELDPGARGILGKEVGSASLARASFAGFAVLALLALVGACTRAARRAAFVWLMPLALWLGTVPFAVNFSRFRAPLDPFLILLAALAAVAVAERISAALPRRPRAERAPLAPVPRGG